MSALIKAHETLLEIYFGLIDIKHINTVILDELSTCRYPNCGAYLFRPISHLYEKTSLISTTKVNFAE
jgi:hypothetical protein